MPCILRTVHTSNDYAGKKVAICARSMPARPSHESAPAPHLVRRDGGGGGSGVIIVVIVLVVVAVIVVDCFWNCLKRAHAEAYAKSGKRAHAVRRPGYCAYPRGYSATRNVERGVEMPAYPPPAYKTKPKSSGRSAPRVERWTPLQSIGEFVTGGGGRTRTAGSRGARTHGSSRTAGYVRSQQQRSAAANPANGSARVVRGESEAHGAPSADEYLHGR
ncbi:hypothetical protein LTR09_009158 [Extremus antarcticus]|uniref:Uncharacterized protein n=1 Tax=Extremus antarcticus TaxID=702011 RepID=A0AAJ0DGJ8_9PEZI|nr:hypothetical protein LTR09_009158 [Extremus antarcticus]